MKRVFYYGLLLILATTLCCCSSGPKNINEIPDVRTYKVVDLVTGKEYQIAYITTIPNEEYEITLGNGKKRKIIDDEPRVLAGAADMDGNIIIPLQYAKVSSPVNGHFKVKLHYTPDHYNFAGVYDSEGNIAVPIEYHSLEIDKQGRGAFATISNPDGRTRKNYAIDFQNDNKITLLPYDGLISGINDEGRISIRAHNKEKRLFETYYFDFSGNEITE